jgi:hypothetical protein
MTRQRRLTSGRAWLSNYSGKNVLRGYCKHFAVNWRCAAIELEILGIKIDTAYLAQRETTEAATIKHRKNAKLQSTVTQIEHWHPFTSPLDAYLAGDYAAVYDLESEV